MALRPATLRFKLDGIEEVSAVLQGISTEMQRIILAEGVAAGAEPVVKHAKRLAPRETGALQKSISAVVRKPRKKYIVYAVIGPARGYWLHGRAMRRGTRSPEARAPANYGHLLEYGHISVKPTKGATRRKGTAMDVGFVAPRPFLTPALFAAYRESGDLVADGLRRGIEKARARLAKKTAA